MRQAPAQTDRPVPAEATAEQTQLDDLSPSSLPTRQPGASYTAPDVAERTVETSSRDPEEIKSALSSYQLGVTVGRDSNKEEVHHE